MNDVERVLRGPVLEVAPTMLGWSLSHDTSDGRVTVRLTEVEAYGGAADPASHAARGRTLRTEVMFGPPARLYVYFSYGMHWCANVVVGPAGEASAVLLRAGRVVDGVDLARARRPPGTPERSLARGPACLTQALGISRVHNGADLRGASALVLMPGERAVDVSAGARVGVSLAAGVPWRFWVTGDETVSAYKRSPRAP